MSLIISLIPKAYAQGIINPVIDPSVGTGPGEPIIGRVIGAVVGVFIVVGAIMALLHLLFGAVKWITAGGDKTQMENARERITQAIIGLIILASVWALMVFIGSFLGLNFPNFTLPGIAVP